VQGLIKAISGGKLSPEGVVGGGRCNIFELKETRTNERKMKEWDLSKGGKVTAPGAFDQFSACETRCGESRGCLRSEHGYVGFCGGWLRGWLIVGGRVGVCMCVCGLRGGG